MFNIKTNNSYFKKENEKYEGMIDFVFDQKSAKNFNTLEEAKEIVNKLHSLGYSEIEIIWIS